jgi:hypothetical protein
MEELFFSERRAAVRLGIGRMTLRRKRAAGLVKALCLGGAVLYSESELERFKASYGRAVERRRQ